jgi:hypothetical protein
MRCICADRPTNAAGSRLDKQIRNFLDGLSHGEDLLHRLYDHILEEKVPARLVAVLRG